MLSLGVSVSKEDLDLPKLYWIPKFHKNPYTQRNIAGSARCSTKSLSQILTRILTAVKEELQRYVALHSLGVAEIRYRSSEVPKNFSGQLEIPVIFED